MKNLVMLGETLEVERLKWGLTIVDAAEQADVDPQRIVALEAGEPYAGCPRDLWALSKLYDLNYADLMILAGCLVPKEAGP